MLSPDSFAHLSEGDFVPVEVTKADYARMADLVDQYADFPLGTSDASVVALAERLDEPRGRDS